MYSVFGNIILQSFKDKVSKIDIIQRFPELSDTCFYVYNLRSKNGKKIYP